MGVWNLLVLKHSGLGVACENGNRSVGTAAGQDQTVFGRCKADAVHRRVVVAVLVPLVPLAVCFLPDDDFAIVAAARQDVAEARMSPCNLPNGSAVSFQIGFQTLSAVLDVEDLRRSTKNEGTQLKFMFLSFLTFTPLSELQVAKLRP